MSWLELEDERQERDYKAHANCPLLGGQAYVMEAVLRNNSYEFRLSRWESIRLIPAHALQQSFGIEVQSATTQPNSV
jgi:hypothetical protein